MSKSSRRRRTRKPKPPGIVLLILSFIFRLLLLVVAASFSWILGMAIALKSPSTSTEMPLAEKLRRNYQNLVAQKPVSTPRPTPNPIDSTPTPQIQLSEAERKQLQAELKELQEKLNTLIGETAAVEIQLGISRPTEKLENRLQLLAQQLAPPALEEQPIVKSSPPVFAGDSLMVTLPSDVLFEGSNYTLRLNANLILDNLVADLKNYRGADILVGAHTDDLGDNQENSDLSLLRAETVREYLSKNLGADRDRYHWVVVGYGETRPIVENKTKIDRQRNRRIEVKINR